MNDLNYYIEYLKERGYEPTSFEDFSKLFAQKEQAIAAERYKALVMDAFFGMLAADALGGRFVI